MLPRIIAAPFVILPRSEWDDKNEKKGRINLNEVLHSSSSESEYDSDDFEESELSPSESSSFNIAESPSAPKTSLNLLDSPDSIVKPIIVSKLDHVAIRAQSVPSSVPHTKVKKQLDIWTDVSSTTRVAARLINVVKEGLRQSETYIDFQNWRARKARERRHHLLKYYEEKIIRFDEQREAQIEAEMAAHRRVLLKEIKRRAEKLNNVRKKKTLSEQLSEEFRKNMQIRNHEAARMEFLTRTMPVWADQNHERRLEEDRVRIEAEEAERQRKERKRVRKEKRLKLEAEAKALQEDYQQSQEIIRMMRQTGTIEGVNPPAAQARQPQSEMSRDVELRLREDIDFSKSYKKVPGQKQRTTVFEIDLLAFRNAVALKVRDVGERGALALGADLVRGACPRLELLDLTRCQIRARGLGRLLHGIRMANLFNLRRLILRGNGITARGVEYLVMSITNGALLDLRLLDLSENEVGDDGAKAIAHGLIKGCFKQLDELFLERNGIADEGFSAIVNAVNSTSFTTCTKLSRIYLQGNRISAEIKQLYHPLSAIIAV